MNGDLAWWIELLAALLWSGALGTTALGWRRPGTVGRWPGSLTAAGLAVCLGLLTWLWLHLGRPPLRTLGETRLWYATLSVLAGGILAWRVGSAAPRPPMLVLGTLFLGLNLAMPQALDRTLMPALQSPWFVPHVVVYLTSYAVLGLSAALAAGSLLRRGGPARPALPLALVHLGLPLLTIGLCLGAIWAKEAWGTYWSWDPKETWALLTWIAYVALIHAEPAFADRPRIACLAVAGCFAVVLGCWFLVNHLPSTAVSVHTYAQS